MIEPVLQDQYEDEVSMLIKPVACTTNINDASRVVSDATIWSITQGE